MLTSDWFLVAACCAAAVLAWTVVTVGKAKPDPTGADFDKRGY